MSISISIQELIFNIVSGVGSEVREISIPSCAWPLEGGANDVQGMLRARFRGCGGRGGSSISSANPFLCLPTVCLLVLVRIAEVRGEKWRGRGVLRSIQKLISFLNSEVKVVVVGTE